MTNPAAPAATEPTARRHIGLLLFDDVEELDAVGPWEVLSYWTLHHPEDGWSISCISRDGQPVRRQGPHARRPPLVRHDAAARRPHPPRRPRHPTPDARPRPPGVGPRPARVGPADDERLHRRPGVRGRRPADRAPGHHPLGDVDLLTQLDPTIVHRVEARFVDDGDLITSAGVSAGIDMALHLVARLVGRERAREVRRAIQYDPQPPV